MRRFLVLLNKEVRDLLLSRAAFVLYLLTCITIGYSFFTAASLYSTASMSAVDNPLYATGFEPVPGVFTPTVGGLFIVFSLFLPFVLISRVTLEQQHNTLAVLLQVPYSWGQIVAAKLLAATLFITTLLGLMLPAAVIWIIWGGHLPLAEFTLLAAGYLLYGFFVVSVSFFAASCFPDTARASITAICLIMASWLLDFGRDMNVSPLITVAANASVTQALKQIEGGILAIRTVLYLMILSLTLCVSGYWLLRFDLRGKWRYLLATMLACSAITTASWFLYQSHDLTESRRNSFPPHIVKSLQSLPDLAVSIYLEKTDTRYKDYQKSFLEKLLLVRNDVQVTFITGEKLKEQYGKFIYRIGNKEDTTFSNSTGEIFPLLFSIADIKPEATPEQPHYPGYPLVVSSQRQSLVIWIYLLIIPGGLVALWFGFTLYFRKER